MEEGVELAALWSAEVPEAGAELLAALWSAGVLEAGAELLAALWSAGVLALALAEGEAVALALELAGLPAADWSGVVLAAPLFEAEAPAPGVLVAVSPVALGLVPVVLAVPAFAVCEEDALPLIFGLLPAEAVLLGELPAAVVACEF